MRKLVILCLLILVSSFAVAQHGDGSAYAVGPAWHWLQDIYSSNGVRADSNNDGATDTSNNLRVNNSVAKVFSVAGGNVILQITGAAGSYSSVDFMSGGAGAWGIGRDNTGNFYIERTGAGNALTIDASRNIGIGNSAPTQKLDVTGNIRCSGSLSAVNTITGSDVCTSGGICLSAAALATADNWAESGNNIYSTNTGNVGIGTNSPGTKLQVSGSVQATSFLYSSDAVLKRDIKPLEGSLDKINLLQGVSFAWRDGSDESIGLIAQDVERVYPELVSTDGHTGLKSIEYANLVAPLIEAVKEQQRQIDELQEEVDDLKQACKE